MGPVQSPYDHNGPNDNYSWAIKSETYYNLDSQYTTVAPTVPL